MNDPVGGAPADARLVEQWVPCLGEVATRLDYGGAIADVGCGRGGAAIQLALAYPLTTVHGFDRDGRAVEHARDAARAAGVEGRCSFDEVPETEVPAGSYDMLCLLDRLRDVTDPLGVARRARKVLAPDGAVLVVEPMVGSLPPRGQTGPDAVADLLRRAGFGDVQIAATTPLDCVVVARPGARESVPDRRRDSLA